MTCQHEVKCGIQDPTDLAGYEAPIGDLLSSAR